MKLTGCVLLFLAVSGMGIYASMELNRRIKQLHELQKVVVYLIREVDYQLSPISEALKNTAKRMKMPWQEVLNRIRTDLMERKELDEVVQNSLRIARKMHPWNSDLSILESMIKSLGQVDKQSQISHLKIVQEELVQAEQEAIEAQKEKGQLYKSLGVCMGVLSIIILL